MTRLARRRFARPIPTTTTCSLAAAARAVIVSGDRHFTDLPGQLPVYTPAQFLDLLADQ